MQITWNTDSDSEYKLWIDTFEQCSSLLKNVPGVIRVQRLGISITTLGRRNARRRRTGSLNSSSTFQLFQGVEKNLSGEPLKHWFQNEDLRKLQAACESG